MTKIRLPKLTGIQSIYVAFQAGVYVQWPARTELAISVEVR